MIYEWPLAAPMVDFKHRGLTFHAVFQWHPTRAAYELVVLCGADTAARIGSPEKVRARLTQAAKHVPWVELQTVEASKP